MWSNSSQINFSFFEFVWTYDLELELAETFKICQNIQMNVRFSLHVY